MILSSTISDCFWPAHYLLSRSQGQTDELGKNYAINLLLFVKPVNKYKTTMFLFHQRTCNIEFILFILSIGPKKENKSELGIGMQCKTIIDAI